MNPTNRIVAVLVLVLLALLAFASPPRPRPRSITRDDSRTPMALPWQMANTTSLFRSGTSYPEALASPNQIWGPYILDGAAGTGHGAKADLVDGRFKRYHRRNRHGQPFAYHGMSTTANRYIQIQVNANAAISPRQVILAAPRALSADFAAVANITPSGSFHRYLKYNPLRAAACESLVNTARQ